MSTPITYPAPPADDRAAIHALLMRYFHAADRGDKVGVRACFTDDVHAQYEGRPPVHGADALIAQIALFDNLASGACRISTHFAGNLVFRRLEGDFAETENNAFAALVRSDGATLDFRSMRYLDRLRRENGQWKIFARVHTLDWRCELPVAFARPFADKVEDFPPDWPRS